MAGAQDVEGVVKWYSPEKGYGFVAAHDGGKDVFVNAACLRRSGVPSIDSDMPCRTTYVTTPRGREARYIRVTAA
jgi:CspA family cold shock protein